MRRHEPPEGWRIDHHDFRRDVYTLERTRWFFKGRLLVLTGEEMYLAVLGRRKQAEHAAQARRRA